MISIIVVVLVGIGFTRLTMLALEMRDEDDNLFESAPAETLLRKEIITARMSAMEKPSVLIVTGEDQCKVPGGELPSIDQGVTCDADCFDSLMPDKRDIGIITNDRDKLMGEEEKITSNGYMGEGITTIPSEHSVSGSRDESHIDMNEIAVDANSLCIICFERIKNAVFLNCGHGGVCYACALDTCVVSGKCPLCRSLISQIVIVESKGTLYYKENKTDKTNPQTVRVVGP